MHKERNMKLAIGENIRSFRRKNDLTQEAFANQLGVTYQSVSRWENGTTYPDLELLPAISEALSVTVDELLGMPQAEKEKKALETFDELRRECMKRDYDADRIVALLRDIRRNYLNSRFASRPWCEGNDRTFRDPKILPEVRLLAGEYLERHPMDADTIRAMAYIEDEEHLKEFLSKYTTPYDCSERALLLGRYLRRGDAERYEPERRFQLYQAFNQLLCPQLLLKWGEDREGRIAANEFMNAMLSLIRCDAVHEGPDMWVVHRIETGLRSAVYLVDNGRFDDAIAKLTTVVELLEKTMEITEETILGTSCRFLDGMECKATEHWHTSDNSPDSPEERMIYIWTDTNGMDACDCVYPSQTLYKLQSGYFDPLRDNSDFKNLCERVKALIVTREKEK